MSEAKPRSKKYVWFLIIFMGLISLIDTYLSLIESTVIPYIVSDFNITNNIFTFWAGIFGAVGFLVFIISWISDRFGRKKGILALLLVMSTGSLMIGLVGNIAFPLFLIFYSIILLGVTSNLWALPVSEESPADKRGLYGSLVFLIGLIPIYALIGEPIAEAFGWQWTYGIVGIFGLCLVPVWYFMMKETDRWIKEREELGFSVESFRDSVKKFRKVDWKNIALAGTFFVIWNVAFKYANLAAGTYFKGVIGYTPATWTVLLLICGLMTILGALSSGILMEKVGRLKTMAFAAIASVLGYWLLGFTGNPFFLILIYYTMSTFSGFLTVYNSELFPTKIRGTALGILAFLSRFGYIFGPLLSSVFIPAIATPDTFDQFILYWFVGGCLLIIPLIALIFKPFETRSKTLEEIEFETGGALK